MSKKRTYYIDRFDRGIQQSPRAQFEDAGIIGFQKCSHFDVFTDPKRLIPMPGFEEQLGGFDFVDGDSVRFSPVNIGGDGERVYAAGNTLTNWYNYLWAYRTSITPQATYFNGTNTPYVYLDLSNMPADFWTNVQSNGGDIRITTSDGITERPIHITEFDKDANTGNLYIGGSLDASGFFVYYGNVNGDTVPGYTNVVSEFGRNNVFRSLMLAYTFDNGEDNDDVTRLGGKDLAGSRTAVPGLAGNGVSIASNMLVQNPPNPSNTYTFSFLLNLNGSTAARQILEYGTEFQVNIVSGPKLRTNIDYTNDNNETLTSSNNLPTSGWTLVTIAQDGDVQTIWFDKTQVGTIDHNASGVIDWELAFQYLVLGSARWDQFVLDNDVWDTALVETMSDMFQNNSLFWSAGTEEERSAVTLTYDQFQIWTKLHSEEEWYGLADNDFVAARDLSNDVTSRAQLLVGNDIIGFASSRNGFNQLGSFTRSNGIEVELQSIPADNSGAFNLTDFIVFARAADNVLYGGGYSDKLYAVTDGAATEVYDAGKRIRSLASYGDYLAIGTSKGDSNIVEVFDLARSDPFTTIDFGSGTLGPLAQVGDALIGVVTNDLEYINLSELEAETKPRNGYFAIRAAVGNKAKDIFKRTINIKNEDTNPVMYPYCFTEDNRMKFYFDEAGERGIYEVGQNSVGELILNTPIALNQIYEIAGGVTNYWIGHGHAYFIFTLSGAEYVFRLGTTPSTGLFPITPSPTYPDGYLISATPSYFETTIIGSDTPQFRKSIREIVLGTSALTADAQVNIKFRRTGSSDWTLIHTMDEEGQIRKRIRRTSAGEVLPTFEEGEFRVESYGGAEITEFEVVTELLES